MTYHGGCNCGTVRYTVLKDPLFTHVCHCRQCQRSSGGAFNISTVVLVEDFKFENCRPDTHLVSGPTGNQYEAWACDKCGCTIGGKTIEPSKTMVLRPGTLDNAENINPQAHIWTSEKQPWFSIPRDIPAFPQNYEAESIWPESSLQRLNNAKLI